MGKKTGTRRAWPKATKDWSHGGAWNWHMWYRSTRKSREVFKIAAIPAIALVKFWDLQPMLEETQSINSCHPTAPGKYRNSTAGNVDLLAILPYSRNHDTYRFILVLTPFIQIISTKTYRNNVYQAAEVVYLVQNRTKQPMIHVFRIDTCAWIGKLMQQIEPIKREGNN